MAKSRKPPGSRKETASDRRSHSGGERHFPTREQVLSFISDNPGETGKREIARAFNIKGAAKITLKAMLKELAEEGLIEKSGKRIIRHGDLPRVSVLDIVARDSGGGLLARPSAWDEETGGKAPAISIRPPKGRSAVVAGLGDRVLARIERDSEDGRYNARVIKIIDKRKDAVLGVVRIDGDHARLLPVQKRQEEIDLEPDMLGGAKHQDLVEVQVSKIGRHGLKRGKVIRVIGSLASEKAASMIAIHANGIPHIFPDAVLDEAARTVAIRPGGKGVKHEDWRDVPLITIDPADAKDHDDAVFAHADPGNPGGFVAIVAIADVSWYVRHGSAMDREALMRGNSVYFPDRVVPMLPERISNDLCSLREGEDRPALAVKMWFSADGRKARHSFHRVIMRSHAKLAYQQAQTAIDGSADEKTAPLLESVLKPLWDAYHCLKRGRDAREPLDLDLPERRIILKADGTVDRVIVPERLDAHRLIEEFMIQANVAAAETLEHKRQPLIYRVHDQPSLDKLESLREFLKSLNLSLSRGGNLRPSMFNGILASVAGSDREELVNQVVLRSQSQAVYSPDNLGHFGLNLMRYAHFTSPIRRYADLIVHRALVAALGLGEGGLEREQEGMLEEIAADISMTERRAMQAERETIDRLIAMHLSEQIGERFSGRINGVSRAGLFVTLAGTGADGFIPISMVSDEYQIFDEANYALVGDETGLTYQMGQTVEVRLVEAAPVAGALRFEMISPGKPSKGLQRSARTNKPAGRRGLRGGPARRHGPQGRGTGKGRRK
ncbi:MAG: ribonuclease R [Nitratireductor sp.]|nr:ribonuclease R [Nitratireductor sp.]